MAIQFCAIDASISCTALAILSITDDHKFLVIDKVSISTKKTYPDRWQKKLDMRALFEFYLKDKIENISFFVFENYSYGSAGHLADLGELNGMYKHYISSFEKAIDVIPPATVKKLVAGSGKAKKDEVQAALANHVVNFKELKFNNFDESDAIAIGVGYALRMIEANKNESGEG